MAEAPHSQCYCTCIANVRCPLHAVDAACSPAVCTGCSGTVGCWGVRPPATLATCGDGTGSHGGEHGHWHPPGSNAMACTALAWPGGSGLSKAGQPQPCAADRMPRQCCSIQEGLRRLFVFCGGCLCLDMLNNRDNNATGCRRRPSSTAASLCAVPVCCPADSVNRGGGAPGVIQVCMCVPVHVCALVQTDRKPASNNTGCSPSPPLGSTTAWALYWVWPSALAR